MDDQKAVRKSCGDRKGSTRFSERDGTALFVIGRIRKRPNPLVAFERFKDRRVHRMESQARVRQPFREMLDGDVVVIVEMGTRREDLNGVESMRRDVHQVLARQTRLMKQVRRNPETALSQTINRSS